MEPQQTVSTRPMAHLLMLAIFYPLRSIQFITNCEQQSGFIQRNTEENNPGIRYMYNESRLMTTLLGNPNQKELCHANIKFESEILSVTRIIARKHATSRSRKILPIFKTCYFCVKLKTWRQLACQKYKSEQVARSCRLWSTLSIIVYFTIRYYTKSARHSMLPFQ